MIRREMIPKQACFDMKFEMTKPCKNCPFRTDSLKGWLGKNRAKEIAFAIIQQQGTFPCHKTVDYDSDEEGEGVANGDSQHCAGAMIMLEHMEKPNQMMRIAERIGLYDMRKLDMKSPVFKNDKQFIKHHAR